MSCAIYVVASSSSHAIGVLSDTAEPTDDEQTKLGLRESFYVDEKKSDTDTEDQATRMRQSSVKNCLHNRNWARNSKVVMNEIPDKLHENK